LSTKEKLLEKARRNPRNLSRDEFESLVRAYGDIEEGGSHPKAIIGDYTLPYKRENPIKACYTKDLIEIIDSMKKTTGKNKGK
jgi:hypothetical protein